MIKSLRPLLLAGLLFPLALPVSADPINTRLSPNVEKALKASKLQDNALSLVMIPLNGPGTPTIFNADVSVNPASTMKPPPCSGPKIFTPSSGTCDIQAVRGHTTSSKGLAGIASISKSVVRT